MAGESLELLNSIISNEHATATEIANRWLEWDGLREPHKRRIREVKSYVFATSTKETSNDKNDHNHSTNIPKICQIYDNLKANYISGLMPNKRWFQFEGEDKASVTVEKRQNIASYLRTKHRQNKFRSVISALVDDWIIEGNCFAMVTYLSQSHTLPDGEFVNGYSGPAVKRISPNDIVFNPIASSFKTTPKIFRSLKSLGELARDVEENPELGYEKEIFDKVAETRKLVAGSSVEEIDKSTQITMDGFGSYGAYLKGGVVEILEMYGDIFDLDSMTLLKNHVVTVVDRKWVIRKQPVDTWNGHPYIFHAGWRPRPDNLWAMAPLENLVGMQYKINHLENARADAFDSMLIADRVVIGDIEEIVTDESGAKTYFIHSEKGNVRNLSPDPTVLNADFQISATEEKMELFAGAPKEAVGVRTPGEKTKFEVAKLDDARGRLFQHKMTEFEINLLEDILNAEVEQARKNLVSGKQTETIRIDQNSGIKTFKKISREDITANGKIIPIGARHYARQSQLAQNLAQFMTVLAQDREMAMHFPSIPLAKTWEQLMEFEEFDLVQEYGRIPEQAEAARRTQAAQRQVQEEDQTPLENEGEDTQNA